MLVMSVTCPTSHFRKGRLKRSASLNMKRMSVTLDVSQVSSGWLNLFAPSNMWDISRTPETFQRLMSWLKYIAPANMFFIVTTFEVSHVSRPAKFLRLDCLKRPSMSVMHDVSMAPSGIRSLMSISSVSSRFERGLCFTVPVPAGTAPRSSGWAASSSFLYSAVCLLS